MNFHLDRANRALWDADGRRFDAANRSWSRDTVRAGERVDAITACTWLQRESGHPCRVPIGVIGPRDATAAQLHVAEAVGRGIAAMGLVILCGGRGGVMAAVAKGAHAVGGTSVGLLPDSEA